MSGLKLGDETLPVNSLETLTACADQVHMLTAATTTTTGRGTEYEAGESVKLELGSDGSGDWVAHNSLT